MLLDFLSKMFGEQKDVFIDVRDKRKYRTVKIGNQIWMAENLKFICSNCLGNQSKIYGNLYSFEQALDSCPYGWHLPSYDEWAILIDYLGGESVAGGKMKNKIFWDAPNKGASNSSCFNALPAGSFDHRNRVFFNLGYTTCFWSSTPLKGESNVAWVCGLESYSSEANIRTHQFYEVSSIRCLKD